MLHFGDGRPSPGRLQGTVLLEKIFERHLWTRRKPPTPNRQHIAAEARQQSTVNSQRATVNRQQNPPGGRTANLLLLSTSLHQLPRHTQTASALSLILSSVHLPHCTEYFSLYVEQYTAVIYVISCIERTSIVKI
jgi:hypothetical protein